MMIDDEANPPLFETLTAAEREVLVIRAEVVRAMTLDRGPFRSQMHDREGRIGSSELARIFDPLEETAAHVAGLLLGLGEADEAWLVAAGIPMDLITRIHPLAPAWLSGEASPAANDRWTARLARSFTADARPSCGELEAEVFEWSAWRAALEIVTPRPWLSISWVRFPDEEDGHLVVHDGALGSAVHFRQGEGPVLAGGGIEPIVLDGEDLPTRSEASSGGDEVDEHFIDWVAHWGLPVAEAMVSDRVAVFEILQASRMGSDLAANDGYVWRARPAALASPEGSSAYDLLDVFPTARPAIQHYRELLVAEVDAAGHGNDSMHWHEPLWVVHRGRLPVLLFDEAGDVHMPSSTWLAKAQHRAVLGSSSHARVWAPMSFKAAQLLAAAESRGSGWTGGARGMVGDLVRGGAGYVADYLDL